MNWLSAVETSAVIESLSCDPTRHWAVSQFVSNAFFSMDFMPSDEWSSAVHLSEDGERVKSLILEKVDGATDALTNFFVMRRFFERSLLVDCERTKAQDIENLLDAIAKSGSARWPYVFGKELYKKFNDTYDGNRTNFLEAESVQHLLEGTPQGIFQLGSLVSGPLGFVHSEQRRCIPPLLQMPLWHCSDVGCGTLHVVAAKPFNSGFTSFVRAATRILSDSLGPRSEWQLALNKRAKGNVPPSGRLYADMPAVVCDCIQGGEVQVLCERALRSAAGSVIKNKVSQKRQLSGSPSDTVASMTMTECRQLLLLFKDEDLVVFLDELIESGHIDIPPTEVRRPRTYARSGYNDHHTELSSLGTRSTLRPPVMRLYGEVWQAYSDNDALGELEWKMRRTKDQLDGLRIVLMDYIRNSGPETTITNLIFSSQLVSEQIGRSLQFHLSASDTEQESAKKLLWKFGFSTPRYGRDQELIKNRMAEFKKAALRFPTRPSEEDRASLRSVGVNLFVSVEGFLEDVLAFNVWVITSDHFAGTGFLYNKTRALQAVRDHLGASIGSGENKSYWNISGANTLGVLLTYLSTFRTWLGERKQTDKALVEKHKDGLPHYAEDPLVSFPFKHRELWADASSELMNTYAGLIDDIYRQLIQADLPLVRNGLDHKRSDAEFPTADKMLACISRLETVFDLADHRNLIPKLIWQTHAEWDSYGNSTSSLRDYKGSTITFQGPPPIPNTRIAGFGVPFVAAPLNFLALPNAHMLFNISENSAYSDYWTDYPTRRTIPSKNSQSKDGLVLEPDPKSSELETAQFDQS